MRLRLCRLATCSGLMMTDEEEPTVRSEAERWGVFGYWMRRVIGPAGAVVVFYASVFSLPSLMTSQAPPIDGGDMGRVFLISIAVFAVLAVLLDYREKRKKGDSHEG